MTTEELQARPLRAEGGRVRHRPNYFQYRGDEYDFNRLADSGSLACLDRYCAEEQRWPLTSGWILYPTGAEVRDIIRQVHDIDVPERGEKPAPVEVAPPIGDSEVIPEASGTPAAEAVEMVSEQSDEEPPNALEDELQCLKNRNAFLEAENEALRTSPDLPAPDEPDDDPSGEDEGTFSEDIPPSLQRYAEADEGPEEFRQRLHRLLFRFGIKEGEHFLGGGEPLSIDEKIKLLPMLVANFKAGNWLKLSDELEPKD